MNYDMIVNHMKSLKSYPLWQFGAPWFRLRYDPDSGALGLVWKDYGTKDWKNVEDSPMIIRPDNTMEFVDGHLSGVVLGTLGIAGRFRNRSGAVIRSRYQHNCMTDYVAFPGLLIDIRTGKPLNSQLVKDVVFDEDKRKQVDAQLKGFKTLCLQMIRLNDLVFRREYNIKYQLGQKESWRDDTICRTLEQLPDNWFDGIECCLREFARTTKWERDDPPLDPSKLVDRMLKFHKSSIYRHFGVF